MSLWSQSLLYIKPVSCGKIVFVDPDVIEQGERVRLLCPHGLLPVVRLDPALHLRRPQRGNRRLGRVQVNELARFISGNHLKML